MRLQPVLAAVRIVEVTLNPTTVRFILGLFIPLVVAALTKYRAPDRVRVLVSLVLSIVAGLITTATRDDGTAVISQMMLTDAAWTFIIQLAAYLGLWKPAANVNAKVGPGVGLG